MIRATAYHTKAADASLGKCLGETQTIDYSLGTMVY